jgi:hypothetical protein
LRLPAESESIRKVGKDCERRDIAFQAEKDRGGGSPRLSPWCSRGFDEEGRGGLRRCEWVGGVDVVSRHRARERLVPKLLAPLLGPATDLSLSCVDDSRKPA